MEGPEETLRLNYTPGREDEVRCQTCSDVSKRISVNSLYKRSK